MCTGSTDTPPLFHLSNPCPRNCKLRKHNTLQIFITLSLLFLTLVTPAIGSQAAPAQQAPTSEEKAQTLLENLTPEERVGQLFLVTFEGTDISEGTRANDLIVNHHVGGVVLRARNNNFIGPENTIPMVISVTQSLQLAEWMGAQQMLTNTANLPFTPAYIPLFIGISQEGDGYPHDQILTGITQLPNHMAIGATWDPALAQATGEAMGQELSALGFNLLLGPSLDVLESPSPESGGDLGTRTFGGDPFWVAQMGRAYIEGLHAGGDGKLMVIGKHFPGHGGSDRMPEEEVPTIRKSLEQLKQIELAPFFAVTGDALTPEATLDGLLVSHIRYQGFQGNIRATTRPISFDEQALSQLMELPAFSSWRANGGILVSGDLGSQAVRRLIDPSGLSFNARLVARDAFLAGNDLIYLGDFIDTGDPDSYTTIVRTLEFFVTKYLEDPAFAERVDSVVLRILTQKFRSYSVFSLGNILPDEEGLSAVGSHTSLTFDIARQGVTLISPSLADLDTVLPDAPGINDRIVFISDSFNVQQCAECAEQPALAHDALEQTVFRLYGPSAGNQVLERNLTSYTFTELQAMLDRDAGYALTEGGIRSATWIVFAMLDVHNDREASLALRRFLSERPDLTTQKRVILFAFNAPYYLDATDISKLTAYYGLYGKSSEFVDIAARLLYKEITVPTGAPPVTVQGIGYDLIAVTAPNLEQIIPIVPDTPDAGEDASDEPSTPEPTPIPQFEIGDTIPIRTGVIFDHNGNPVPDGTPVQFIFSVAGEESFSAPVETVEGIARITFTVANSGPLEIRAISEPATQSQPLQFDVPQPEELEITPTPQPSPTAIPPTPTATEIAPAMTPVPTPTPTPPHSETDLIDWGTSLAAIVVLSFAAYWLSTLTGQVRWSIRWGLSTMIGGLLFYIFLALKLLGSEVILLSAGRGGILSMVLIGSVVGWGVGLVWRAIDKRLRN